MDDIHSRRRYIEAALEYASGTYTFDDIVAGVEQGDFQFWPGPNSAIVTQVCEYPQKRVLHIFLAAGNLGELSMMRPVIEQYGRDQGCTSASLTGRKGWERTFIADAGYAPVLVQYVKEIL